MSGPKQFEFSCPCLGIMCGLYSLPSRFMVLMLRTSCIAYIFGYSLLSFLICFRALKLRSEAVEPIPRAKEWIRIVDPAHSAQQETITVRRQFGPQGFLCRHVNLGEKGVLRKRRRLHAACLSFFV